MYEYLRKLSIKRKILTIPSVLGVAFALILLVTFLESGAQGSQNRLNDFNTYLLESQNITHQFLSTKDTSIVAKFTHVSTKLNEAAEAFGDDDEMIRLKNHLNDYQTKFTSVIQLTIEKGLNEKLGLQGEFRSSVHNIEEILKALNKDELEIIMLNIRRAEKDYLLRGSEKYIGKVAELIAELKTSVNKQTIPQAQKTKILSDADIYQNKFGLLVENIKTINAVKAEYTADFTAMEPLVMAMIDGNKTVATVFNVLFYLIIIASIALGIVFSLKLADLISTPIIELTGDARIIAEGKDITIICDQEDEIGELAKTLNLMVNNRSHLLKKIEEEKSHIEDRVREATQEMNNQNKVMNQMMDGVLAGLDEFALGNLAIILEPKTQNELEMKLFSGFNNAIFKMNEMLQKVITAVKSASSSSISISSSTENVAGGVSQQSMQIDEVAAAVEEMTQTIAQNAQNATQTAHFAKENGEIANQGGTIVQSTINKINDIAKVVERSTNGITEIASSINQINSIVAVVEDIARQTNLLALNAAIEAASAGEHGRGFSVVADEVRKLAERTSNATKQIAKMIHGLQNEMEEIVDIMNQGGDEVRLGLSLADDAGKALSEILRSTDNVLDMINQIAAANEEQSATSMDIAKNIDSISSVSANSAEGVKEIAESTEEMSRLTKSIAEMVSGFKLH